MQLLTENDVVLSVVRDLVRQGYTIRSSCDTATAGIDIHAVRGPKALFVEAKGVTSSKPSSTRFGKQQSASQLFIQVAAALLKCMEFRSEHPQAAAAMAMPAHPGMVRRVNKIKVALEAAGISVIWVDTAMGVSYWNAPWSIPT